MLSVQQMSRGDCIVDKQPRDGGEQKRNTKEQISFMRKSIQNRVCFYFIFAPIFSYFTKFLQILFIDCR